MSSSNIVAPKMNHESEVSVVGPVSFLIDTLLKPNIKNKYKNNIWFFASVVIEWGLDRLKRG